MAMVLDDDEEEGGQFESVESLYHTSVIRRLLCADLPVRGRGLLGLPVGFAAPGPVAVQDVLQEVFALAGGQVVEEVLGRHFNKPVK